MCYINLIYENTFPFFEIQEESGTLIHNSIVQITGREELYEDFLGISRAHPETTIAVGLHTMNHGARHNSLVMYQNGAPVGYYSKRKLLPFAEFTPSFFPIPTLISFSEGDPVQLTTLGKVRVSGLVCSEVADASLSLTGSDIILVPSNDSVLSGDGAALMHHQMARMRALENSAYVLRATKGGITSIIGRSGEVIAMKKGGSLRANIGGACVKQ